MNQIKITGSGSYIPTIVQKNDAFLEQSFVERDGSAFTTTTAEIIDKFKAITGIEERKYAPSELNSSDLATIASEKAIADAQVDPETLDYIILAHNFGDVKSSNRLVDTLPSLASRVKANLNIKNPNCVAYDLLFGCPGWVEGLIQAQAFIKAGMAQKCLVIGADTLSRVYDLEDRDSMIYADGAGAVIVENSQEAGGILAHATQTFTAEGEADFIHFGKGYNVNANGQEQYIKMQGRKVYEFAITNVPLAMQACFDKTEQPIEKLKKIFIHQANLKMDEAIVKRFYRRYKMSVPEDVLPMNIQTCGNSSVATVPTLFDMVKQSQYQGHELHAGDLILFASVGAGMNINAIVYQV
ncbi:MAG: 3-oxoacyl-ACP synthase III family protein [Flavobacteriaceae bacterium]